MIAPNVGSMHIEILFTDTVMYIFCWDYWEVWGNVKDIMNNKLTDSSKLELLIPGLGSCPSSTTLKEKYNYCIQFFWGKNCRPYLFVVPVGIIKVLIYQFWICEDSWQEITHSCLLILLINIAIDSNRW